MTYTLPQQDGPGDAELISAVRGGDVSAYGDLFERHVAAARRLARQLTSPADADDLVSEAFTKVLHVLTDGGGPDVAFRAYLLTAVRRLHVDKIRAGARLQPTDDLTPFDPGIPFRDTAVEGFDNAAAAKAFASLPERWQLVLWHTEVEGHKPADIAPMLGMSANSVSALAYRAREGLRQAFLSSHAKDLDDDRCRWTNEHLGGYVRGGLSKRDTAKVQQHLDECRRCMAIYLELTEVNSNLSAILAPLLLGSVGMAYAAAAGGTKGGLFLLLDRAREGVAAHSGLAAAGAVGTVAATVAIAAAVTGGFDNDRRVADPAPRQPISSSSAPANDQPSGPTSPTAPADKKRPDQVGDRDPVRTTDVPRTRPVTPAAAATTPTSAPTNPMPTPAPTRPTNPATNPPSSPAPPRPTPSQESRPMDAKPKPTTPTQPKPTPEPTPEPPATDLTISASGGGGRVLVTTAGYPDATSTAQINVTFRPLDDASPRRSARSISWIDGCGPLRFGGDLIVSTTCTTSQSRPAISFPDFGIGTYTFTATAGSWDSNPGNNTATWPQP